MQFNLSKLSIVILSVAVSASLIGGALTYNHLAIYHHEHHLDGEGHMQHDEVNMPMLNGKDTTKLEVDELKALFNNFEKLTRSVEMLPNGIKTITETDDKELAIALIGHASGMINRVADQRNPEIPIQSDTLTPIFAGGKSIKTTMETTEKGIVVVQTSDDPEIVKALQKHALEVSDLAARGMEAVHDQMMQKMH